MWEIIGGIAIIIGALIVLKLIGDGLKALKLIVGIISAIVLIGYIIITCIT